MNRSRIDVKSTEVRDRLVPLVEGRVFHVTQLTNLAAILEADAILPHVEGTRVSTFGHSSRSFFRLSGCVSLFDWRVPNEEFRVKCWPLPFIAEISEFAVFVLSPSDVHPSGAVGDLGRRRNVIRNDRASRGSRTSRSHLDRSGRRRS